MSSIAHGWTSMQMMGRVTCRVSCPMQTVPLPWTRLPSYLSCATSSMLLLLQALRLFNPAPEINWLRWEMKQLEQIEARKARCVQYAVPCRVRLMTTMPRHIKPHGDQCRPAGGQQVHGARNVCSAMRTQPHVSFRSNRLTQGWADAQNGGDHVYFSWLLVFQQSLSYCQYAAKAHPSQSMHAVHPNTVACPNA